MQRKGRQCGKWISLSFQWQSQFFRRSYHSGDQVQLVWISPQLDRSFFFFFLPHVSPPVWGTCVTVSLTLDGSVPAKKEASTLIWPLWAGEVFVFTLSSMVWQKKRWIISFQTDKTVRILHETILFQMENKWKMLPVWSWPPLCCSAAVVRAPASICVAAGEGSKSQHLPRFKRGLLFTPRDTIIPQVYYFGKAELLTVIDFCS